MVSPSVQEIQRRRSRTDAAMRRDKRIFSTGCAGESVLETEVRWLVPDTRPAEQLKMNDCYYEKRDWRACKKEVSFFFSLFTLTAQLLTKEYLPRYFGACLCGPFPAPVRWTFLNKL